MFRVLNEIFTVCTPNTKGDEDFLKMERCYFTGNQGLGSREDYGAALAFSLQIMLREKESLHRHEVVDR